MFVYGVRAGLSDGSAPALDGAVGRRFQKEDEGSDEREGWRGRRAIAFFARSDSRVELQMG